MKDTYLGEAYTRVNKDHECFGCGTTIKPDPNKRTQIRHDVWKTWKTVVNKYYCSNCERLVDYATDVDDNCNSLKPFNPEKNKFKKFRYKVFLLVYKIFN